MHLNSSNCKQEVLKNKASSEGSELHDEEADTDEDDTCREDELPQPNRSPCLDNSSSPDVKIWLTLDTERYIGEKLGQGCI